MFSDEWDNFVLMALKNDPPPETVEDTDEEKDACFTSFREAIRRNQRGSNS